MDVNEITTSTWDHLNDTLYDGVGFSATHLTIDDRQLLCFLYLDINGKPSLAIDTDGKDVQPLLPFVKSFKGLSINITEFTIQGMGDRKFVNFKCTLHYFRETFTAFVKDISSKLESSDRINSIREALTKWISFWRPDLSRALNERQQLGLIAELLILDVILDQTGSEGIVYWTGPENSRQDFSLPGISIEIKSSLSVKRKHIVNGLHQLLPNSPSEDLFLVSVVVSSPSTGSNFRLDQLVANISHRHFDTRYDLESLFQDLLYDVGYHAAHSTLYSSFCIDVEDIRVYKVDEEFPKLSNQKLSPVNQSRVFNVRYTIDLDDYTYESIESIIRAINRSD